MSEPLEVEEPLVKFEFIRMPDSTGFGDYTESGQVIPVTFNGRKGGYTHCMFLDDHPPIAGGRELWGFPKKLAKPRLKAQIDTLVGELYYGPLRIAVGTMGYKHREADLAAVIATLEAPNFLLKIIPHVDGSPRICEIVEYPLTDIDLKGAWNGPAQLTCSRMLSRRSLNCRCLKWCQPPISWPTSRSASGSLFTTTWPERHSCRGRTRPPPGALCNFGGCDVAFKADFNYRNPSAKILP